MSFFINFKFSITCTNGKYLEKYQSKARHVLTSLLVLLFIIDTFSKNFNADLSKKLSVLGTLASL